MNDQKPLAGEPSVEQAGRADNPVANIELARTFVRIVEAGSLSAAARQLHTTQPTVSRRLKQLEQAYGVQLLQRSTHRMRLTEDGRRCFARANLLLDSWEAFESEMRGAHGTPEGVLRVIVPHAFGQELLIRPLSVYLSRYPGMRVEWLLHDDRALEDFIAAGVDCAIRVGEVSDQELVSIKLGEVSRSLIAAPALFAQRSPPEHPGDLSGLPWLALRTYYRNRISLRHGQTGEVRHVSISPRLLTDSLYALRTATLRGLGVSLGSAWVIRQDVADGRLVSLLRDWQPEPLPVTLVYRYASNYPARLRCFVDIFREHLPGMLGLSDVAG